MSKSFLTKLRAAACNFIKKGSPKQAFSCEFCEILQYNYFTEYLRIASSKYLLLSYANKTFGGTWFSI